MKLIVYTDGGARGNPGHAAIGVVIKDTSAGSGQVKKYSEYIGDATNNVAEYKALILGLKKAKQVVGKDLARKTEIDVRSDSELMIRQLSGRYKLKDENIQKLFIEVWNLKTEFKSVSFKHIPREENSVADGLVNEELDSRKRMF